MKRITNMTQINLSVAVWLATDNYDHNHDPQTISVTTLMKPVRQIVLSQRLNQDESLNDVVNLVPSALGSAYHDAIERAWKDPTTALKTLGYPAKTVARILINPTKDQLYVGCIPVYLEQRSSKQVGKYIVSGKYDFVFDGRVEDHKSTKAFSYTGNKNDAKYALQASLYRWLNPEIITQSVMDINFVITDWSPIKAKSDKDYPQCAVVCKTFDLIPIHQVDTYVVDKLNQIDKYLHAPEEDIPHCTDEDLRRSDTVWKYYKNPNSTGRSTANFDNVRDANIRLHTDGSVGVVREFKGTITACKYCSAYSLCSQKDQYLIDGSLIP